MHFYFPPPSPAPLNPIPECVKAMYGACGSFSAQGNSKFSASQSRYFWRKGLETVYKTVHDTENKTSHHFYNI